MNRPRVPECETSTGRGGGAAGKHVVLRMRGGAGWHGKLDPCDPREALDG